MRRAKRPGQARGGRCRMKANRCVVVASAAVLVWLLLAGCAPWAEEEARREAEAAAAAGKPKIPKSEMKNQWARAKVGDWILLRIPGSRRHQKIEVVKATDVEVLVDTGKGEGEDRYEAINLEDEEKSYKRPEELEGFVSKVEKTENVGGKMIKVVEYTLQGQGNTIINTFSRDVPLDGMVRSVRNNKVGYEVIDFQKN